MPDHGKATMHPKKAELLAGTEQVSQVYDGMLRQALHVVRHPRQYGWSGSLATAALGLPLMGIGAVLSDLSYVLLARSADATWERAFPGSGEGGDRDHTT
jgi:hypothetical protein